MEFHDKIRKKSLNICFLALSEEFRRTRKRVRISHGKRDVGCRAIDVRLYLFVVLQLLRIGYTW